MNAIEVRDLAVSYGQVDALHGVSFDVPQGTLVSLIGANGAGKTTLLKALMGALPARAARCCCRASPWATRRSKSACGAACAWCRRSARCSPR